MRVKTLTLTTASAAALTIGLASPVLALGTTAGAVHSQTGFGAQHQGALHDGLHHMVALPKGDDDDDDDGDGGGDGAADIGGVQRTRHFGPRGLCGVGGRIGGLAQGCGEEAGDDDDDDGPGGGDFGSEDTTACCQSGGGVAHVKVSRPAAPAAVPRRYYMPRAAVRAGFGGSQGMNLPLGVAGLSLLAGGAGLLPLARRRLQASARS